MMNKYNALERLTAIEKEATELRKILEAPEVKELPKTWADLGRVGGCFVDSESSNIGKLPKRYKTNSTARNIFPTKSDAYRYGVLLPQLLQLRRVYIDSIQEGWEADWDNTEIKKLVIRRKGDNIETDSVYVCQQVFSFPSSDVRNMFFNRFRPQLRIFFGIDPIPTDI